MDIESWEADTFNINFDGRFFILASFCSMFSLAL